MKQVTKAIGETLRPIIAHDPIRAQEQRDQLQQAIDELTRMADPWTRKLDSEDEGQSPRSETIGQRRQGAVL